MDAYFLQLNRVLQQVGTGMPQLIVDIQALNQNLQLVQQQLPLSLNARLVVKSLACLELLKYCSTQLNTQRFMLFHLPHVNTLFSAFPEADILFGKPMPIQALKNLEVLELKRTQSQVQWLIDSARRLQQYLDLAVQYELCLNINIEIDVGLHRGGVKTTEELAELLTLIQQHPAQLKFSGLMGYDAHVSKIPTIIQSADKTYQQSQQSYQQFKAFIRSDFPDLYHDNLCWNGGGSPSFRFHCQHSVCNEVSFGSMLLKPQDFDLASLESFQSALWIATPILKLLPHASLPQLEWLDRCAKGNQAAFIYGGYWRANYVYPKGSKPHLLYGRSSNQELVQIPKAAEVHVDDYVFLRPTQSESIIPQFAALHAYENGRVLAWENFRE